MKKILKKSLTSAILGAAFIGGAVVYASATIPGACSTPGTCTDITSTFQAIVSKTSVKFLDSDASNSISIKAPADVAADVNLTLPATAGNDGEVLKTDGSGNLAFTKAIDLVVNKTGLVNGDLLKYDAANDKLIKSSTSTIQVIEITGMRTGNATFGDGDTINFPVKSNNANFIEIRFRENGGSQRQFTETVQVNTGHNEHFLASPFDTWHAEGKIISKGSANTQIQFWDGNMDAVVIGVIAKKRTLIKRIN